MATTSHLGLTLVEMVQAQKEVTVNAALSKIDALMNTGAMDKDLSAPPLSPITGDVYIVATGATDDWAGHENAIAYYDQNWRFITPREGMTLWVNDEDMLYSFDGSDWVVSGAGALSSSDISDFTEAAQDAAGAMLTDSASIDFTYNDGANTISAAVIQSAIDHGSIAGLSDDDHTQYHTNARALTWLGTRSTSDVAEGSNLYYTAERVDDRVAALLTEGEGVDLAYNDGAGTLTISGEDATHTNKGIASFNATNFSVTSGAVNSVQNIHTAATPTFSSLSLTSTTGLVSSASLDLSTQSIALVTFGSDSSVMYDGNPFQIYWSNPDTGTGALRFQDTAGSLYYGLEAAFFNGSHLGSWNGSPITPQYGGTGLTSYAQGDIIYASGTNTLFKLAKNTSATRYLSNTGTNNNPAWAQIDLTNGVTGILPGANGGTGVNNSGKTITLGGNLTTSGAFATTLTTTAITNVTLPTTGTLATLAGAESLTNKKLGSLTTNGFVKTSGGDGTLSVDTNTYITGNQTITLSGDVSGSGTTAITTTIGALKVTNAMLAGAIDLTTKVTGDLPFANLAQGSALSVLGVTGNATADVASIAAGADGNVLRRSGTAVSFGAIALGSSNAVSGQLALTNGGTNASLAAVNGGIAYSTASALALSAAGTSGQILRSGGAAAPIWSTATFPATATTAGAYLRADGTNWISSTLILPNAATANRLVYATSTNTFGESANLTFDGTSLTLAGVKSQTNAATASSTGYSYTHNYTGGAFGAAMTGANFDINSNSQASVNRGIISTLTATGGSGATGHAIVGALDGSTQGNAIHGTLIGSTLTNGAAIYGTISGSTSAFPTGVWAGYLDGNTHVEGQFQSTRSTNVANTTGTYAGEFNLTLSGNDTSGSPINYAVRGIASDTGTYNPSTAGQTDLLYGGYFTVSHTGTSGTGSPHTKEVRAVYGLATVTGTVTSGTGTRIAYAGRFDAVGDTNGDSTLYGVYATATSGDTNIGGFFSAATVGFIAQSDNIALRLQNSTGTRYNDFYSNGLIFRGVNASTDNYTFNSVPLTGSFASNGGDFIFTPAGVECASFCHTNNFLRVANCLTVGSSSITSPNTASMAKLLVQNNSVTGYDYNYGHAAFGRNLDSAEMFGALYAGYNTNDGNGFIGVYDMSAGYGNLALQPVAGNVAVGSSSASAKLHVTSSVTNRVIEFTSIATNDDPDTYLVQGRATTGDATITTIQTIGTIANRSYKIRASILGRRTGGTAGTDSDSAGYELVATFRNNSSGTLVQLGTTAILSSQESQAGFDASITLSGTNILVRVQGAMNNNMTWHSDVWVSSLSS